MPNFSKPGGWSFQRVYGGKPSEVPTDFVIVTRRRGGRKGESWNLIGTKSINTKVYFFIRSL